MWKIRRIYITIANVDLDISKKQTKKQVLFIEVVRQDESETWICGLWEINLRSCNEFESVGSEVMRAVKLFNRWQNRIDEKGSVFLKQNVVTLTWFVCFTILVLNVITVVSLAKLAHSSLRSLGDEWYFCHCHCYLHHHSKLNNMDILFVLFYHLHTSQLPCQAIHLGRTKVFKVSTPCICSHSDWKWTPLFW